MPMMNHMGAMPPQMNLGINQSSNSPQQNKPLFPAAAVSFSKNLFPL